MTLKKNVFHLLSFSIADTILTKLLGVLSFYIVVHTLTRSDYGIVGLVGGYLALITILAIRPERIIMRDFPRMKNDLSAYLSSYISFWAFRSLAITIVGGILSVVVYFWTENPILALFLFGSCMALNFRLFENLAKDVFFVSFKQHVATRTSVFLNMFFLALVCILFIKGHVLLYLSFTLISAGVNATIWYVLLKKHFNFHYIHPANFKAIIKGSLTDFSLWSTLDGAMNNLVYRIDTFVLGFFATLAAIGDYSIALEIANFFFIIPVILQNTVFVSMANIREKDRLPEALGIFLKYFIILSITQWIFFVFFGKFLVQIFTTTRIDYIYELSFYILSGVTILNIFKPFSILILSKTNMKKGFFNVNLPAAIISILLYVSMGYSFGIVGVAVANIFAYTALVILTLIYVKRVHPIRPRFSLISESERHLIKELRSPRLEEDI